MKVLVTGSAGFIGSHLMRELGANGHEAVGVDHSDGDLTEPGVIDRHLADYSPDVVVHLAAQVGRLFGEADPRYTVESNAGMTALIAKACGDAGVRLAYASTSEVYGDQGPHLCEEDDPMTLPHNLYGLTKRHGEEICRLYAPEDLNIFRFSMPFGPALPAGIGRAAIINFLYNALHGLPITVHRHSERSWCWIGDTVRGVRIVLESGQDGAWNIGRDDNALPMHTLAEWCCLLTGASFELIQDVDPPERQTVVKRLATDRLRSLGWQPEVELPTGLMRTLEWVKGLPAPTPNLAAVA